MQKQSCKQTPNLFLKLHTRRLATLSACLSGERNDYEGEQVRQAEHWEWSSFHHCQAKALHQDLGLSPSSATTGDNNTVSRLRGTSLAGTIELSQPRAPKLRSVRKLVKCEFWYYRSGLGQETYILSGLPDDFDCGTSMDHLCLFWGVFLDHLFKQFSKGVLGPLRSLRPFQGEVETKLFSVFIHTWLFHSHKCTVFSRFHDVVWKRLYVGQIWESSLLKLH